MSKSKEEIIKAVDDIQKRLEELEASGDPTDGPDVAKYEAALSEIAVLKAKIKAMEDKPGEEKENPDFEEDW